jgi:hypothetical protein
LGDITLQIKNFVAEVFTSSHNGALRYPHLYEV